MTPLHRTHTSGVPTVDLSELTTEDQAALRERWESQKWAPMRERLKALGADAGSPDRRTVLNTRAQARGIVEAHPEINPQHGVRLMATYIETATPSFIEELWKHWPKAWWADGNDEVRETVMYVHQRKAK